MKEFGRAVRFGCLALVVALSTFLAIVVVVVIQQSQLRSGALSAPESPVPVALTSFPSWTPAAAVTVLPETTNTGDLLIVTVVQASPAATVARNPLLEPSPATGHNTATTSEIPSAYSTNSPLTFTATAYLPFFGGQTLSAQRSVTAMLAARTAWYGAMTQGALNLAATLRVLGTPTLGH